MAQVILKGVSKVFTGGVRAVSKADLAVQDKEFVVLVGPSGCGKSTLLRMIAGLEEATEGEIFIDGRKVNDVAPKDRDVAMVFQNYALYPHMTVYDNLAFGLRRRGYSAPEIKARVQEAAGILNIEKMLTRKPKALSGGERQRVAVGRAIVRKPKVFLLDEPLSNLDAKLRVMMRAEIIKLHQRLKTSMIYVTHDQAEAMTMGDRIAVLNKGVIQQVADPLTLYDFPCNLFVAGFVGTPPTNFIKGSLKQGERALSFESDGVRVEVPASSAPSLLKYSQRDVILGIRPEDMGIVAQGVAADCTLRVEVVEPMGSESWVYLAAGGKTLIARMPPTRNRALPKPGQEVAVTLAMEKAHFYDPATETVIV